MRHIYSAGRRIILGLIVVLILIFTFGCTPAQESSMTADTGSDRFQFQLEPQKKSDGMAYRIAVVDLDPYAPASQLFSQFVRRLQEQGWMGDKELMFQDTDDIKTMIAALDGQALDGSVSFDKDLCFYMLYEDLSEIESALREAKDSPEGLDLILAMGTDPGLFVKELDLGVPMLVPMATDPVASGIIQSAQNSGDPLIWALVEPNPMARQLRYYRNMFEIDKLAMVVQAEDQDAAAIGVYEEAARELGITIAKEEISRELQQSDPEAYYETLAGFYEELAWQDGLDAFLLTINVIEEPERCRELFQPFLDAGVPVLVSDGDFYVEQGGMMCVSSYDYSGYGQFTADVAATVFHGVPAGTIPCEFISSPRISLNVDTAKETGYLLDYSLLRSCDILYRNEEGSDDASS